MERFSPTDNLTALIGVFAATLLVALAAILPVLLSLRWRSRGFRSDSNLSRQPQLWFVILISVFNVGLVILLVLNKFKIREDGQ